MRLSRSSAILLIVCIFFVVTASCALCSDANGPIASNSRDDTDSTRAPILNTAPIESQTLTMSESEGMNAGDATSSESLSAITRRASNAPLQTVKDVDLKRFMGKWYEIGRFPNVYQDGVVGVIAQYELRDDGNITVKNFGRSTTLDAELTVSTATAWVANEADQAKWLVQFIWPFTADYWIIDLDEDYQYAVVGQPERERLWILSRRPRLDDLTLSRIYRRLAENGYDTSKIELTPQRSAD